MRLHVFSALLQHSEESAVSCDLPANVAFDSSHGGCSVPALNSLSSTGSCAVSQDHISGFQPHCLSPLNRSEDLLWVGSACS